MLNRVAYALFNPESFWRRILRYGLFNRATAPAEWFAFRHAVSRECAMRENPPGGPPKMRLAEILPSAAGRSCKIEVIPSTAYNVSWEELCTISQIVSALAPRKLFEFGTFDGRTTVHLALNSPDDALTYTLDIQSGAFNFAKDGVYFEQLRIGEHVLGSSLMRKVVMLTGDSKRFDFSSFLGKIDFVFIDADHSYAAVMNDSELAFKIIKPGGVIVWHDYLLVNDVTKAVLQIHRTRPLANIMGTSLVIWQDLR